MRTQVAYCIEFGKGRNAEEHLLYGWHLPEPLFTWASGLESALWLPVFAAPYGCFLELNVQPLTMKGGPQSQRISVAVNGLIVGETTLIKQKVLAFYVPPLDWQSRRFVVTIRHPDAYATPAAKIALAASFYRLRVLALGAALPSTRGRRHGLKTSADNPITEDERSSRDLALSFVSLGFNCEFGFTQRQMGGEPIDLLRFASIPLGRLLDGIDSSFDGLDTPANLRAESERNWDIRDRKYNIAYHTFLTIDDITWNDMVRREVRRLRFLADKLIGDIADADKVFVWWQREHAAIEEIMPLFLAVQRRGRGTLLWVEVGDPCAGLEEVWPGLLRAQISELTAPGQHNIPGGFRRWVPILAMVRDWMSVDGQVKAA